MFPPEDPAALEVLEITFVRQLIQPIPSLQKKITERRNDFLDKANKFATQNEIDGKDDEIDMFTYKLFYY